MLGLKLNLGQLPWTTKPPIKSPFTPSSSDSSRVELKLLEIEVDDAPEMAKQTEI